MKLMSLFDGSGGFPLAASLCGIEPVYAAEVEPYPIAVTKNRFPKMKHLGDVSKVKGGEIEPVDIITFGSPCQDMSIAGKRAGLKHADMGDDETTRSGLFLEAIRIIKEMREATNGVYPRYAIWENVPGAFSSNRGEDFRTVLEEFIRVKEKDAVMPPVPKAGWAYADYISGDGWSVAYRTFDAQYWGVPQRRRRIYLVADFRGQRAGEILFKPESLRGNSAESGTSGQETTANAQGSTGTDDREGKCLTTYSFDSLSSNSMKSKNPHSGCRAVEIAKTLDTGYPDPSKNQGGIAIVQPIIVDSIGGKAETAWQGDTAPCLKATHYKSPPCITVSAGFCPEESEKAGALKARDYKDATDLVLEEKPIILDRAFFNQGKNAKYDPQYYTDGICPTLVARGPAAVQARYIVRRLTPTEFARLQGFPSWWGIVNPVENLTDEDYAFWLNVRNTYAEINGKATKEYTKQQMLSWYNKLHSDSAEYKMWGNGIALPNALYVMQGIAEVVGVHHSK